MKIYIEALVPTVLALIVLLWWIYKILTDKLYKWRYKPENDRGKLGEDKRKENLSRGINQVPSRIGDPISNLEGQRESEGRGPVQTTAVKLVGQTGNSIGKTFRNPFRRKN